MSIKGYWYISFIATLSLIVGFFRIASLQAQEERVFRPAQEREDSKHEYRGGRDIRRGKRARRRQKSAFQKEQKKINTPKTLSHMNFIELKDAKNKLIAKNNKHVAIKYIERMLTLCEDVTEISELTIELADLYFDTGELAKAETLYTQFSRLYPGSSIIEYASYKAVLCSFYATLTSDRDQSKTHETIALADAFIERKNIFTNYVDEVITIRTSCYQKVVESEITIFNFYLNRGKFVSARHRLANIRTEWSTKFPEVTVQLAQLELQLNDTITTLARNNKPKKVSQPKERMHVSQNSTLLAQAEQPSNQVSAIGDGTRVSDSSLYEMGEKKEASQNNFTSRF